MLLLFPWTDIHMVDANNVRISRKNVINRTIYRGFVAFLILLTILQSTMAAQYLGDNCSAHSFCVCCFPIVGPNQSSNDCPHSIIPTSNATKSVNCPFSLSPFSLGLIGVYYSFSGICWYAHPNINSWGFSAGQNHYLPNYNRTVLASLFFCWLTLSFPSSLKGILMGESEVAT